MRQAFQNPRLENGVYRVTVAPVPPPKAVVKAPEQFPFVFCTIVAQQDGKEIGRLSDTITINLRL